MSIVKSIFNFLRFNKKNWKAVVLCIFAATVFWFFNALNKNYSTNLNFPVTFDYDQEHYIPVQALPASVRMNVTGPGWDLFRRSLGFKVPPLVVPLEKPADVRKIVGTTLPAIFAGQLERLKINFIITDTVHLSIKERLRRKFYVQIDSVQQFLHPDFGVVDKPVLKPDTIWVEGPSDVVLTMPDTFLISLPQNNIRKDFNENVDLPLESRNRISIQPEKINVLFSVEKFVNVDKQVRLNILNLPSRLKQSSVIREVSCTYRLPASFVKTFSGDSLEAVVDLDHKPKGTHKLVPQIIGLPPQAILIKADTVVVNF